MSLDIPERVVELPQQVGDIGGEDRVQHLELFGLILGELPQVEALEDLAVAARVGEVPRRQLLLALDLRELALQVLQVEERLRLGWD